MIAIKQIRREIARSKPALRKRYGVRSLGLFGSYARNEQNSKSDIDILVEFDGSIGLLKFMELESNLSELFGRRVDLVMKSALKPRIGQRILQEVLPL